MFIKIIVVLLILTFLPCYVKGISAPKNCLECHDSDTQKGDFDIEKNFSNPKFLDIMFENVITGKMPPKNKQINDRERSDLLSLLSEKDKPINFQSRRRSSIEFNNSLRDIFGTGNNYLNILLDDIGSYRFDTNCQIELRNEHFESYFAAIGKILDDAFPPKNQFPKSQKWNLSEFYTSNSKDSFANQQGGNLFTSPVQKNGTYFPSFFKRFEAPSNGFYDLAFIARNTYEKKHANLTFISGRVYTDPSQSISNMNHLHKSLSIGGMIDKTYKTRIYLNAGEHLGIYCYSQDTLNLSPKKGIGTIIGNLKVNGPVKALWPPKAYKQLLANAVFETIEEGDYRRIILKNESSKLLGASLKKASASILGPSITIDFSDILLSYKKNKDFFSALKNGLRIILTSEDFVSIKTRNLNTSNVQDFLARALWRSVPDAQLRQTDSFNELTIRKEIARLFDDKKSMRMITSFCDMWLNLKNFDNGTPSLKLYPLYNLTLHRDLPHETYNYIEYLIHNNLSAKYLIDSNFLIINQRIAEHYGIPDVYGHNFQKIIIPREVKRGGLMTMGSILKVTADGFQTSPISRGTWISRRILGNPIAPPPPSAFIEEPDLRHAKTIREELEAHQNKKTCFNCHKSIDPYGLALESYDASGKFRSKYRIENSTTKATFVWHKQGHYTETTAVDASGELPEGKFSDIESMKPLLKSSVKKVAYNFAKNYYEYLNGEPPSLNMRIKLWNLGDPGMKSLITSIIFLTLKERKL